MSSRQGQHAVQETSLRHVVLHVEHLTNRQRAVQHVVREISLRHAEHPISLQHAERHVGRLTNRQHVVLHVEHPINKQEFQERRSGSHEPVFFISMAHYR